MFVSNRDDDTVSVLDLEAAELITHLSVGDEPFGIVAGSEGRLYVANTGSGTIQIIDQLTLETLATIPVEPQPRALALTSDQGELVVTHFSSGKLSVIDTETLNVEAVISTGPDSNLSQGVLLDPASQRAYLPHTRSNVTNQALLFDDTVFPVVSVVDLPARQHLRSERIFLDLEDTPVGLPLDAALTSSGKLYVLNAGSNDVSVIDAATRRGLAHIEVGDNPRGIVLSPDETRLYVNNTLSGSLSVVDTLIDQVIDEVIVTELPLPPDVLNGKILFNTSSRPDVSRDQWIACTTCHFDATLDHRTWFFADGPRNTPSLLGVRDTLPVHWSGDLDELQDTESTVRNIQAGTGLVEGPSNCDPACDQAPANAGRSKDLDDLAAYMRFVSLPPNPNLTRDGTLTEAAERGRAIFLSADAGCASCHVPPLYTDLQKHDVGTGVSPLETKGTLFDTPSLRGVYQTGPYLHDGSAETLIDVLTTNNQSDEHGQTSDLTLDQLQDLEHFLLSLPYEIPVEGFAQFSSGRGISSTLIFVNPSSTRPATGTVSVFDAEGKAVPVGITPNGAQQGNFLFQVPAASAAFYDFDGEESVLTGWARIDPNFQLGGTILFSGQSGVAAVGAARALMDFLIPIESNTSTGIRTGVAISNPADSQTELTLTLRDLAGQPIPSGSISMSLPPNGRLASFMEEIFAGSEISVSDFRGSLEVSSSAPTIAMVIRVSPKQFATLPVTGVTSGTRSLHFAQFANGQGISSTLMLINPSSSKAASGRVRLFDGDGDPLQVDIDGMVQNGGFDFSLPPRGIGFYSSSGMGDLKTGWVDLTSNLPVDGMILFAGSFGSAGVGKADRMDRFLVPVESDASRQVRTGVAVANPISSPIQITLALRDGDGVPVPAGRVVVVLPAHGRLARFPEEMFDGKNIDFSDFRGVLEVSAPIPVVGVAIRASSGEFAALPVTRMN